MASSQGRAPGLTSAAIAFAAANVPMPAAGTALAIAAASALCGIVYHLAQPVRSRIKLPGPPSDPIAGHTAQIIKNIDQRYEWFCDVFDKYGPNVTLSAPFFVTTQVVITIDPAVVQHILRDNFDNYVKGPVLHRNFLPLLGDGIFSTDGELWRMQRKTSSHIFTGRMFREVVERVVIEALERLLQYLGRVADTDAECDIHAVLHTFTLDAFAKIGFGVELNGLENPDDKPAFAAAFDRLTAILSWRFSNPLWKFTEHIYGTRKNLNDDVKIIDKFAYDCIESKKKERAERGEETAKGRRDLLDLFMDVTLDDDAKLNDKQLRDMILNMILAGRDTTAQALSWCFFRLSSHPEVVNKMRDELADVLEDKIPGFDEVGKLKYINAVFLEAQRLHPSVPSDVKTSVKADVLPGGIEIPAGTEVSWFNLGMGRSEWIWGLDAKEFKPERWIDENGNLKRESPFKFPAFNAGPRVCLGQQMAIVEGVQVLAGMCRDFDFARVGGNDQPAPLPAIAITNMMATPLMMYVTRRRKIGE